MPKAVDKNYRYTDADIRAVLVAKDADRSNAKKKSGFLQLPYQVDQEESQIIATYGDDGKAEGFLRNKSGGINLRMESMSLTGEESVIAHEYYMPDTLKQLRYLESVSDADLGFAKGKIYPAQILFPLNIGNYHWIAAQVMVDKDADGKYTLTFAQYDPMRLYPDGISSNIIDKFCDQFQEIFELGNHDLAIAEPNKSDQIGRKVANADGTVRTERMQQGGLACGIYTVEALHALQTKDPQEMWDDFGDDDVYASAKRRQHIDLVASSAAISAEGRENFVSYRHNRLGARASVKDKKDDFAKFIKEAIEGKHSKLQLLEKISEVRDDGLWKGILTADVLKALGDGIIASKESPLKQVHSTILEILSYKVPADLREEILSGFIDSNETQGAAIAYHVVGMIGGDIGTEEIDAKKAKEMIADNCDKAVEKFTQALKEIDSDDSEASRIAHQNQANTKFLNQALKEVGRNVDKSHIGLAQTLLVLGAQVDKEAKEMFDKLDDEGKEFIADFKKKIAAQYLFNLAKFGSDIAVFKDEIKRQPVDILSVKEGDYLLHFALENANPEFFLAVLEAEELSWQINERSAGNGDSVLQRAVFLKKDEAIKALLSKGALVDGVDGQKMSEIAGIVGVSKGVIDLIVAKEGLLKAKKAKDDLLEKATENSKKISNFIQSIFVNTAKDEAKQALRDVGITIFSQLDEIVAGVLRLEEYASAVASGISGRNLESDNKIAALHDIVEVAAEVDMAKKLAAFLVKNKMVHVEKAAPKAPPKVVDKVVDKGFGGYKSTPLFNPNEMMRDKAKKLLGERQKSVAEKVAEQQKTIDSLKQDLVAVEEKLAKEGADVEALGKEKLKIQSKIESVNYGISTLQRRKTLSIDKSDFFSSQELKQLKNNGNNGQILITAQDFHLACVPAEAGKEGKRAQVHGALADVFAVNSKDGGVANFQPYFANFGGVYFKEAPNDGNPKTRIFGEAEMFMANFSRGENGFGKGCTFENVDFSMMGGSEVAALKIFATMQIENCVFIGCNFPDGVKFNKDAGEIVLPKGLKEAANDLRAAFSRINAMDDKSEAEKNKMIEGVWQEFKDLPRLDDAFHVNVSNDDKWAAILKRSAPPSPAVKPIGYKCLVIEHMPVEIVL